MNRRKTRRVSPRGTPPGGRLLFTVPARALPGTLGDNKAIHFEEIKQEITRDKNRKGLP